MNDIFISYAHDDNEPLPGQDKGWITFLHNCLRLYLINYLTKPAIWRDLAMSKNDSLRDTVFENLKQSRTLVAVLTPTYLYDSQWCPDELKTFEDEIGAFANNKSLIFFVIKAPLERDQIPQVGGRETLNYQFFERLKEKKMPILFEPSHNKEINQKFIDRIQELAFDIAETFKVINPLRLTNNKQVGVFLSEPTDDLKDKFDSVRLDLISRGFKVASSEKKPEFADEYKKIVKNNLNGCKLGVHLIGNEYSGKPRDSEFSYLQLQTDVTSELGFKRLIWLPNDVKPFDDRHREFIQKLTESPNYNSDLFRGSLEGLKERIQDILSAQLNLSTTAKNKVDEKIPEPNLSKSPYARKKIYVIYLEDDISAARDVVNQINQHVYDKDGKHHYIAVPAADYLYEKDRINSEEQHKKNLRDCDVALIYWNTATATWVREMESDILSMMGDDDNKPFLGTAIFISGNSRAKEDYSTVNSIQRNLPELDEYLDKLLKEENDHA